jgi:hypothetical protein
MSIDDVYFGRSEICLEVHVKNKLCVHINHLAQLLDTVRF